MPNNSSYVIKGPEDNKNCVELWSTKRLPFEPKGWLLEMRNSLRSRIERLCAGNETVFHAVYYSELEEFCDVENILIYNVGAGAFKHLCQRSLFIERRMLPPPVEQTGDLKGVRHYHRYNVIKEDKENQYWEKGETLSTWRDVRCPPLRSNIKPHHIWHYLKKAEIEINDVPIIPYIYGIELKIRAPLGKRVNLASVIKPLLDGVICAFHAHDGSNLPGITRRLSLMLQEKESNLADMLLNCERSVLGVRSLLHPFRQGVQWNPADDGCVLIKVQCDYTENENVWFLNGEIYELGEQKYTG